MELTLVTPPKKIRRGTDKSFNELLETIQKGYYIIGHRYHLDMTDVVFMDSYGCGLIFNYWSVFTKITPPKDPYIIEIYNLWLDSKKGLKK